MIPGSSPGRAVALMCNYLAVTAQGRLSTARQLCFLAQLLRRESSRKTLNGAAVALMCNYRAMAAQGRLPIARQFSECGFERYFYINRSDRKFNLGEGPDDF